MNIKFELFSIFEYYIKTNADYPNYEDYEYGQDYDSCEQSYYDTDESGECHHNYFPQTPIQDLDIFRNKPIKRCCEDHAYVHFDTCEVGN